VIAYPVVLRTGLASRGRVATVRPLTGADEAALAARRDLGTEPWLTAVLVACVAEVADAGVSAEDARALTVGDRTALALAAIVASYGAGVSWVLDCPSCGEKLDAALNLRELLAVAEDAPPAALPEGWRLPTGADVEAIAGASDAEAAEADLVRRCGPTDVDEDAVRAFSAALADADPLADIEVSLACAACGTTVAAGLDPVAELTTRLARPADLVADVHALALAYGWTEADVLALARPRRIDYLTLLADGAA